MNEKAKKHYNDNVFLSALKVNGGILLVYVILLIIASLISPSFMTVRNQMSILRSISTTALCSFGMCLVILTGGIDLSVGAFESLCGCLVAVLLVKTGMSVLPAILIALLVGIAGGILNGVLITKMSIPPFIGTLAVMNIFRGSSYLMTGGLPVVFSELPQAEGYLKVGTGFLGVIPYPVIYVVVAFIVLWFILNRTRFGKHIFAVGGNILAAQYSGINTKVTQIVTYAISGLLSAFAGVVLISRVGSGQPTVGEGAELDAIAACVVGGVSMQGGSGTLTGTLIGCLLMGSISSILNLKMVNSFAQLVVKGIIIIFAVFVDVIRQHRKIAKKAKKEGEPA